jgi:hypothetical protein
MRTLIEDKFVELQKRVANQLRGTAEHLAIVTIGSEASKALCMEEVRTFVEPRRFLPPG